MKVRKELSFEQALKKLKEGKALEVQLSSRTDNTETVLKEDRLRYLYELSKQRVQLCKIFEKVPEKVKISEDEIEISFDEAYEMVVKGEAVYCKDGNKEEKIVTIVQLKTLRRMFETEGKQLFLYWHE